jgi:cell division protein FtsB
MNALTKLSIALLVLATAGAVYLYVMVGDEGFEAVRSQPQDAICEQDGARLARLQARPSLDEALSFVSEIRCLQLWPQLQTVVEGLSSPSRSTASSSSNGAASGTISASDAALATAARAAEATSAALDDACKHDEDQLVELKANPSIDAAIRFDNELKCPRLQLQLPAILARLSNAAGSLQAPSRNAPPRDTMSAGAAAPPAPESPPLEAMATTSDDACKHDEERLAELQAKPSLKDAVRFEDELKCSKLQPQLLAILDSLSHPAQAAETASSNKAPPNTTSAGAVGVESVGETRAPASEPPPAEAASAGSDDACRQDEERLARLRATPSSGEAARFAQELRCETLRPQLMALTDALAKPSPPDSHGVSQDAGAERNANETQPASQAAAEADRRIATLESENEMLAAEVGRLQRNQESLVEQVVPPAAPQPAIPAERSETQPASQAAMDNERRIAQLKSENEALTAKVSGLERDRGASSVDHAVSPASPPPAAPAERSHSELGATLASLPEGMPARVLIRYLSNNTDAQAQAEKLANALKRQGVEVVDLRESRTAIRTELSFSYAPDEAIAQQVGRLVGVAPVRRLQPKDGLMVRPGTVELNLSGDSHLVAIKTTSSRESNHE